MAIQHANLPVTTLNGAINASVTTITLTSATLFPATGQFVIIIDSERILVGGVSGNNLTSCTRGFENTTAASHSNGASVAAIQSDHMLRVWMADACLRSNFSGVMTAGISGRINFITDSPFLAVDNGTSLQYHGPIWEMTEPINGDYVWVNQGTGTVSTTNGGVLLTETSSGTSNNLRIRKKSKPSVPYTITSYGLPSWGRIGATGVYNAGILMRESSTSKLATWQFTITSNGDFVYLEQSRWSNATTYVSSPVLIDLKDQVYDGAPWLQMSETSTNIVFRFSMDGFNFFTVLDQAKTNAFTTAPDEVGFFINASNTTNNPSYHLLSWVQT